MWGSYAVFIEYFNNCLVRVQASSFFNAVPFLIPFLLPIAS